MAFERGTAVKLRVGEVLEGEFHRGEGQMEPNYLLLSQRGKVSRVRLLGTIVSRFMSEDQKYATLTLDDGTDTIALRAFREEVEIFREVKIGDDVDVIGKVKEYEGERYVSPEIVRRLEDPHWELVRRLELFLEEERLREEGTPSPQRTERSERGSVEEEVVEGLREEGGASDEEPQAAPDQKMLVLELIERLGGEGGVKYLTLLEESGLSDEELEEVLSEMMGDGEIYEPKIGRFKRV
jgi:RPA family protein